MEGLAMLKRVKGSLASLVVSNASKTDYWRQQRLGGDHGATRYFNQEESDLADLWGPVRPWTAGI